MAKLLPSGRGRDGFPFAASGGYGWRSTTGGSSHRYDATCPGECPSAAGTGEIVVCATAVNPDRYRLKPLSGEYEDAAGKPLGFRLSKESTVSGKVEQVDILNAPSNRLLIDLNFGF
ncbi:hypothetical protein KY084_07200 [Stakelama sp. CBK3Z-3]|uniref:Uncharacterized protein n=1 Tax=Stakelama flava TaxID=2860338 RepID=A0ABS6XKD1_9SPHN|nr:hypothetical protein [Stakelama flava]MBW4330663.1 hypothetical protein [Stakelama flava]